MILKRDRKGLEVKAADRGCYIVSLVPKRSQDRTHQHAEMTSTLSSASRVLRAAVLYCAARGPNSGIACDELDISLRPAEARDHYRRGTLKLEARPVHPLEKRPSPSRKVGADVAQPRPG